MLASFERTTDILYDAAIYSKKDSEFGVSENIILVLFLDKTFFLIVYKWNFKFSLSINKIIVNFVH